MTSLGLHVYWTIGIWVMICLLVIAIASLFLYSITDSEGWLFPLFFSGLPFMVGALAIALFAFPYQGKYLEVHEITGTVTSITNTWGEDDGSMVRTPVFELDSFPYPIEAADLRIVKLLGQEARFVCSIGWVYEGLDTYKCAIAEVISR